MVTEYDLTYRISKDTEKRSPLTRISDLFTGSDKHAISITNRYPINENDDRQLIALDITELEKGSYILEIYVTYPGDDEILAKTTKAIIVSS